MYPVHSDVTKLSIDGVFHGRDRNEWRAAIAGAMARIDFGTRRAPTICWTNRYHPAHLPWAMPKPGEKPFRKNS
jgi:hypothetical protein